MLDQIWQGEKIVSQFARVCHIITVVANKLQAHESYLLNKMEQVWQYFNLKEKSATAECKICFVYFQLVFC